MSFASEWRRKRETAASAAPAALVEKATSDLLAEPDWAANMDVCDLINSDLRQAREAIKAVRKRLVHRSPMVQFLALTLLETMVKNCGDYVHLQVVECEVLDEMVRIIKKKGDELVREKILILLDAWQEAFGGPQGQYPQYFWAYSELKGSGIQFPFKSRDTVPIFTPPITKPSLQTPFQHHRDSSSSVTLDEAIASENIILSSSDFHSVRRVMELLRDMLEVVNLNDYEALSDEVIVDLVKQCCSNQKKIMLLINSTRNEELLSQALALNDDLQNLIAKYSSLTTGQPVPSVEPRYLSAQNPVPTKSSGQFEEEDEDEDDGFTQLARRNSNVTRSTSTNTPSQSGCTMALDSGVASSAELTSTSMSGSTSAATFQTGEDIATYLRSLSIGQLPFASKPPTNTSTFVPSSSYPSMPLFPGNSQFTSVTSSSIVPPSINPLCLPPSLHEYANPPVNFSAYPFSPQLQPQPPPQPLPLLQPQAHPVDQCYNPYSSYIVPWAKQPVSYSPYEPDIVENLSSYPPPPWETSPSHENDSFLAPYVQIEYETMHSDPLQLQDSVHSREERPSNETPAASDVPSISSNQNMSFDKEIQVDEVKSDACTSVQGHLGEQHIDRDVPPRPLLGETGSANIIPPGHPLVETSSANPNQ